MKKLEEYKSGEYIKMNNYKAFIPSKTNYNWGWDDTKLDMLLPEAKEKYKDKIIELYDDYEIVINN